MRYEKLGDAIEVIVHFATGKVAPIRFLWKGRAHKVKAIQGRWTTVEGQLRIYHWSVNAENIGICELAMDGDRLAWRIINVAVDN
ncbi:hypothetical protein ACFLQV_04765 [Calditrichota bacterium]